MKHVTLKENKKGFDYVISDVNGCLSVLTSLLDSVKFTSNDRLFLIGNSIDKGAHSKELVEFTKSKNIFPLLGSSELLMLMSLHPSAPPSAVLVFSEQWDHNGGGWRHALSSSEMSKLYSIVSEWPVSITIDGEQKIGLVHSEPPFDSWPEFVNSELTYELLNEATTGQSILQGSRDGFVAGVDCVISGHTQLARPPVLVGNCRFINHGIVIGRKAKIYKVNELI